jgi:hypothetical protein
MKLCKDCKWMEHRSGYMLQFPPSDVICQHEKSPRSLIHGLALGTCAQMRASQCGTLAVLWEPRNG